MKTYTCIKDCYLTYQTCQNDNDVTLQCDFKVGDVVNIIVDGNLYKFPNGLKLYHQIFIRYFA